MESFLALNNLREERKQLMGRLRQIAAEEEQLIMVCRNWLEGDIVAELTPAQMRVLNLLRDNPTLANKELADKLNISTRTVKFHMGNLLALFGVSDRHEMLRKIGKNIITERAI